VLESLLARLIAQVLLEARPCLRPTIRTSDRPQCDERIHVRACPVHAAAFQSRLDHQLVGAFHTAAADRKAQRLETRVLDLVQPFGQIVQRRVARTARIGWVGGLGGRQVGQRFQHFGGTMLIVFENVGLLLDPVIGSRCPEAPGGLRGLGRYSTACGNSKMWTAS